ncbi:MAG: rRNA pseudouridine synthase [Phycisphaerales bacterium]|nr:rRNA pseudouridine synthase [Phycisphaerales bacterium]
MPSERKKRARPGSSGAGEGGPAGGVRLQRFLADAGVASRRHSELLVEEGRVKVNGKTVFELPVFITPGVDRVQVDGTVIEGPERHIYVMLNKPGKTLTTVEDEPGSARRTVLDLVEHPSGARLYPVGRLDYETRGLVLLTNDGDLANKLTHPRFGVEKSYQALVKGYLEEEALEKLEKGIYLAERREGRAVGAVWTGHVKLAILRRDGEGTILEITLKEGRNRQVRPMLAGAGCRVKKLERVAMGPLKLKGLALGEWRELSLVEVQQLRRAVDRGSKAAARAAKNPEAAPEDRPAPKRGANAKPAPKPAPARKPGPKQAPARKPAPRGSGRPTRGPGRRTEGGR